MKVGIICEGEKTDGPVLEVLLKAEFPAIACEVLATSKAAIFQGAGSLIDELLERGCERVLVAWDFLPVGTQMSVSSQSNGDAPCQMDQRKTLLAVANRTGRACSVDVLSLQLRYKFLDSGTASGPERIALVCFRESFDAVFLSDPTFLKKLASSELRDAALPPAMNKPATVVRPQEVLRNYFRKGHNKRLKYFNKCEHNIVLAQEFIDRGKLSKLRKHSGYKRLVERIDGWVSSETSSEAQ